MKSLVLIPMTLMTVMGLAQQPDTLTRVLLGSMGGFSEVPGLSLDYSVGEVAVQTFVSNGGNILLTQGFQQERLYPVNLEDGITAFMSLDFWPNPASTVLNVRLSTDRLLQLKIGIYDLLGRPTGVPDVQLAIQSPVETSFDLSRLAEGSYFLTFASENGTILQSVKFQKLN